MNFLVVPIFEKGRGGGHLARCLELVSSLRLQSQNAYLYIAETVILNFPYSDFNSAYIISNEGIIKGSHWHLIILDYFNTSQKEFEKWSALAPLLGIDEGGDSRDYFDFLIDLLPSPPEFSKPNICAPNLLPLPKNRNSNFFPENKNVKKILVSFGAEDSASLTIPVCHALSSINSVEITALFGKMNMFEDREKITNVEIMESIPNLKECLTKYDLVITHFGLTAFECIYARVPVVLVSPTSYHENLSNSVGFISAGIGSEGVNYLRLLICETGNTISAAFLQVLEGALKKIAIDYNLDIEVPFSLSDLIGTYSPRFSKSCPVCGNSNRFKLTILARFPDRTYKICSYCSMIYMLRPSPPSIEYSYDYFFDFYKSQYGKTYIEDFPNLIKNGKIRLLRIKQFFRFNKNRDKKILDIGCAYGPFLLAAKEEGFSPIGVEPASEAVEYVRNVLKFPVFKGVFPNNYLKDVLNESFDAITLWYVIEHFENPAVVLREIHRLLKSGGVLAFSTPSCGGVSARSSLKDFLKKSPADHFTIWSPKHTRTILKKYGFVVKKVVVSGHHPERFPLFANRLKERRGFLYHLCLCISKIFQLGDTFEVYAIKE